MFYLLIYLVTYFEDFLGFPLSPFIHYELIRCMILMLLILLIVRNYMNHRIFFQIIIHNY